MKGDVMFCFAEVALFFLLPRFVTLNFLVSTRTDTQDWTHFGGAHRSDANKQVRLCNFTCGKNCCLFLFWLPFQGHQWSWAEYAINKLDVILVES